ncbi:beta-1,3-galactosyltransferase 2 isoform X1 [Solea solea]|uniref:beta-1,3-galactosyltransferase 2 isoform X1 n=2 Tax=Solea solea TaxID=90069 RepID=UPI0027296443|nr:beta-1,3-galactosyltransferase 2 isoform X1 [Solea solea]XP_058491197.1 beta-1,3-galactosyltransferase 2 isoform X1 [Solea solea]XP_058491205.1 beta-1,3-galactosyltransferase 2 isoform X1 [Solea solea]
MQWRRRHCCNHTAIFLSLLGVLVFLVYQVWLPRLTGMPWWRGHPVVYGGGGLQNTKAKVNMSSQHSMWRFVIVPQPTTKAHVNASSHEKEDFFPQGDPDFENALAGNTSQSEEREINNIRHGPFHYIINEPDKCVKMSPAPFLVLLIATEARKVEARNAIRQTWGNESVSPALGFIRLFMLGKSEGELGLLQQRMLEAESQRHHDIIQQDFLDSYKNLTIKTLMGMNWVAMHCPQASYVMKTDSDMFVNTEYLIYKLLRPDLNPKKHYFTGNNMRGFAPNRNKNSKWYMPPELYPNEKYPTFCSGTGYVFSGDLAIKIYETSLCIRHLHLEDVYVGICLAKLGIEPTPPPNEFLFNHWRVSYSSCKYSHLITSHGFHPNELLKYWHHLQNNKHNACINSFKERAVKTH